MARDALGEMPHTYFVGGAEQEQLIEENVTAWSRWRLRPRVLFVD
jgi:isopentenyl diphosphate isomerase/L-lactate dehydrogenase-like FMN-dependent dehydrogenase